MWRSCWACMAEESGIGVTAAASMGCGIKEHYTCGSGRTFLFKRSFRTEGGFTVKDTRHLILSSDPGLGIKRLKKEMLA